MRFLTILSLLLVILCFEARSQDLYSARGYWEESTKPNYLSIKQRLDRGDSLTNNEATYLKDYEIYLKSYYEKMSEEARKQFEQFKEQWNKELIVAKAPSSENVNSVENFEWRNRDRIINVLYGAYYGGSIVALLEIDGPAAGGVPLIMGGLWLLGPAINPRKYESITRNTVRANNTGKLLGLGYGAALGLTVAGQSEDSYKAILALSSVGSIALGEVAFHLQKQNNTPRGQIELMRHYGILAPLVGASLLAAGRVENPNLYGLALLGGGVTGLIIGKNVSKKYEYSQGDADAISSLAIISAGLGFTAVADALENSEDPNALVLIPAVTSIIGSVIGQRAVKGVHLTNKQGSTIQLSTAGAALIGFGIVAITQSESPGVIIGVPSVMALITHQALFHNFKMKNLELSLKRSDVKKHDYKFSFNVTPENYLINKKIPAQRYSPQTYSSMQNSLFNLKFTF